MDKALQTTTTANESFLFVILFVFVWFLFPVACIFLFPLLLFRFKFNNTVENIMLFLMAVSFGLIGYTTRSFGTTDSDIARYNALYLNLSNIETTKQFFFVFVIDGSNNVLFYLITYLMAQIFPGNPQVLPLFWVTATYFFSFLVLKELVQYFSLSRKQYILLLFFSCVGLITFYTTTEIIKQTASVSIMCYAIILKVKNKKRSLLMAVISILVHFSSFLILPVFLFCKKQKLVTYLPFIFVACLALSFFNFNILLYSILSLFLHTGSDLLMRVQNYENVETWTISFRFYAVFAMYFFLVIIFYWDYFKIQNEEEKVKKRSLLIIHCLAFFTLLINLNNVHNFIRYVLGYFPFYMAAVAQLFYTRIMKFDKAMLITLVISFYLYSNIKMLIAQTEGPTYANSYMNNDLPKIISSNVIQFLQFRIVN